MLLNGAIIVAAEMPLIGFLEKRNPLRVMGIGVLFVGVGFGFHVPRF